MTEQQQYLKTDEELDERETEALSEDLEPSDEEAEDVTGGHPGHRKRRRRPRPHH